MSIKWTNKTWRLIRLKPAREPWETNKKTRKHNLTVWKIDTFIWKSFCKILNIQAEFESGSGRSAVVKTVFGIHAQILFLLCFILTRVLLEYMGSEEIPSSENQARPFKTRAQSCTQPRNLAPLGSAALPRPPCGHKKQCSPCAGRSYYDKSGSNYCAPTSTQSPRKRGKGYNRIASPTHS